MLKFNVVNADNENNTLTLSEATDAIGVYKVVELSAHMRVHKEYTYYLIVSYPERTHSIFLMQGKNDCALFCLTEDNLHEWEQAKFRRTGLSASVVLDDGTPS